MSYTIDLNQILITTYAEILKNQNLLPGRKMLLENLDQNFQRICCAGVNNLAELKSILSTPLKLSAFSSKTLVPENYLTILKREMSSLEQKPVLLAQFPDLDEQIILKLSSIQVKNSKDFYNFFHSCKDINIVCEKTGLSENEVSAIYSLCSLVRINGVGAVAARAFYESGYTSIPAFAGADAKEMLRRISAVNAERQYYKAKLGEKDMQFTIDFARILLSSEGK